MPQIWQMPAADVPLTGLERVPMNQGGGVDAVRNVPLLASGAPFGGAVLVLDANAQADLSATTDADPGAGCVRWNDADPHAATELYVSDVDGDANDIATALAALDIGGILYVQGSADADALAALQRWRVTSVTAATGYTRLGVVLEASGGVFADEDAIWICIQQPVPSPGVDRNVLTAASSASGAVAFDASLGDYFQTTLTEDTTLTITNAPAVCTIGFWVTQGAGEWTFAFPAGFEWGDGASAPTMPTGDGDVLFVVATTRNAGGAWNASARVES